MQLERQEPDVELVTADPERARGFYAEAMGFAALPTPASALGARHLFRVGGHVLELHAPNAAPERDEGGTNKANGMRLLAFIVDDLDAVLTRFDAAGLRHRALPTPTAAPC